MAAWATSVSSPTQCSPATEGLALAAPSAKLRGGCDESPAESRNGAEVLVDTLIAWGIDRVFGMPGDGIDGVMEALRRRADRIAFVQVRHEESAAFMACAHVVIPVDVQARLR